MSLRRNVAANFLGSAWTALMGLAFVPVYIRILGVESYGVVGVFASLTAMLVLLDLGLSQAMSREMARLAGDEANAAEMGATAFTLEAAYWGVAVLVGVVVASGADYIAYHWLNPDKIMRTELRDALLVMSLVIALRWPVALYTGGLNGLQRQVVLNAAVAGLATLQGLGAVAVLLFVSPTLHAFFVWQVCVACLQIVVLRIALWRVMPPASRPVFDVAVLRKVWRFAAGMSGIAILGTLLTQVDKLVLSKLLPLAEFGYYTFATAVAAVIFRLVGPVFTAYYPRLTQQVAAGAEGDAARDYHLGSQLMSVVILPPVFALVFFSHDVLAVWTRNPDVVANAAMLVSILALGNGINGLMNMPYALQLAHGWTRLAIQANVVAVIVLVPAMYLAAVHSGATGAAWVWVALNVAYLTVGISVMHRRLLKGHQWRWYWNDIVRPAAPALAVFALGFLVVGQLHSTAGKVIGVGSTSAIALAAAILGTPALRTKLVHALGMRFR